MNKFILPGLISLFLIGCTSTPKTVDLTRYEFVHPSMGSLFKVVVYASDSMKVRAHVEESFQELDSLNLIMSDYIPNSELMQLSRSSGSGEFVKVSEDLKDILTLSQFWYDWSGGVFDVTIGPVTQLWRRAKRQGTLPERKYFDRAMAAVGFDLVELDPDHGILLQESNMQLDLGGIAKGYAVDRIFDNLYENGYSRCLVDGAGDLRVGEAPPQKSGWEIAVQTYVGRDSILILSNKAVATSGDFYRNLKIDGKSYSHIIDPATGYGITVSRAVTVIAKDCTTADVLASIFSIVGPYSKLNDKIPDDSEIIIYEKEGEETEVFTLGTKKPQSDM